MSRNPKNNDIQLLNNSKSTLFETASTDSELLHDSIVNIIRMTPEETKNKGGFLKIGYSFSECQFGQVLIASTSKGICYMGFSDDDKLAFQDLQRRFENAQFIQKGDKSHQNVMYVFSNDWTKMDKINLHLKGTDFQLKVWKSVLNIPLGRLTTYGSVAESILKPKAARAIGTAIGSNPIAFLIPCHRVVQTTGGAGGYMWGIKRKMEIIEWEADIRFTNSI